MSNGIIIPLSKRQGILVEKSNRTAGKIFNASLCGDNCAKWIVDIAKRKELTINLHHVMDFSAVGAFDALMLNSEQMIHHYNEYLDEAIGIKER